MFADHINDVALAGARLVLRWVTVRGYTAFVCNQPLRPTQPFTLSGTGNESGPRHSGMLCGWEGNHRSGVALAMRYRPCGISSYGLNELRKGNGHPAYSPTFTLL